MMIVKVKVVKTDECDVSFSVGAPGRLRGTTQGRSTKIISMIEWIRASRLPLKNFVSRPYRGGVLGSLRGTTTGGRMQRFC